ncbi:hypothetical protein [Gloeobacter kilaueensis]|uniref:Uncharacterized protein n=1 Tax=Gloeobacter kilaueensis (strain ATCC BAA-2537 / CCAP 1431/1 / ULC 316 / JS1) TaxID=1183438 RepID=U5QMG4_GLOK1|nr:hypothetical protein [Gloeobacter kilaueensis]AGY60192.1 hypothetical protein GKIL_3946 [Gloeobacter kilaueensis JS1]
MLKRAAFLLLAVPVQAMNVSMAGHFLNLLNPHEPDISVTEYNCEESVEAAPYQSVRIESNGSVTVTSSRISVDPNIQMSDDSDAQSTDEAPDTDEDAETNSGQ